jgi:hypothetical protein
VWKVEELSIDNKPPKSLKKASQFLGEKVGHESVFTLKKHSRVGYFTKIRAHEAMASLLLDEKICFIRLP